MRRRKVLVFGSTGMLGSAAAAAFEGSSQFNVIRLSRTQGHHFDAEKDSLGLILRHLDISEGDLVVNCIGLTKRHIDPAQPSTIERAVKLNVLFPTQLVSEADSLGLRVIQVATDCVFSGKDGNYSESSLHDATDPYGKTKSLGEVRSENMMHIRASLIGPEAEGRASLFFEWVRNARTGSKLPGYVNHLWNGVTAHTFGRIVRGIAEEDYFMPGTFHLVPKDVVTKCRLIEMELSLLGRTDVVVENVYAEESINRTLSTLNTEINKKLFGLAGFDQVPTIGEMMMQMPLARSGRTRE